MTRDHPYMSQLQAFTNPAESVVYFHNRLHLLKINVFLHRFFFACNIKLSLLVRSFFACLFLFLELNSTRLLFTFREIDSHENFIGKAFCSTVFWQDNNEQGSLYNRNWLNIFLLQPFQFEKVKITKKKSIDCLLSSFWAKDKEVVGHNSFKRKIKVPIFH